MIENISRVGAWTNEKETVFTVWAPLKKKVDLIFPDTQIKHALTKDGEGYWSIKLTNIKPGTPYFYLADFFEKPLPDPASRAQHKGVHGPSIITENKFNWNDQDWKGLPLAEMIVYELHVGTFSPEGNFKGVVSKLPYLKNLGINAIELMPVAQFPGSRNWGYDGVYPYAVQDSYGGIEGLKQLVDEAHRNEIAVILDVVYNHLGPEGNYLNEYAPYFTDKYKTGWGSALNFDDAWCDGVRNYFWQNALMWLDEFHVDGLRLDAVHAIWDFSAKHFIEELKNKVSALEKESGRKKILIAEFDLNNPRYINPSEKGGYNLDGQWIDEFHHALHALITGEKDGYYEDFGEISHLAKAIQDSYVYTGQYSIHRKKNFGVKPDNPYNQFVVFSQNHDQVGNRLAGDRLTSHLSFEALKLVAATVLFSPHIPMLFMGEEYAETNPFQYFISHTDKQLVELVRKGRKEEFSYFNWKKEIPDPQSEETFKKCKLSWALEAPQRQVMLTFYKFLIALRKEHPAMKNSERDTVNVLLASNHVLAYEKTNDKNKICVVLNFNRTIASIESPMKGSYNKIFDSASTQWRGPGETKNEDRHQMLLNPQSAVILEL
jgi:maltooligosyltrehalose trehalohydrolase